jgi:hypothetical protein
MLYREIMTVCYPHKTYKIYCGQNKRQSEKLCIKQNNTDGLMRHAVVSNCFQFCKPRFEILAWKWTSLNFFAILYLCFCHSCTSDYVRTDYFDVMFDSLFTSFTSFDATKSESYKASLNKQTIKGIEIRVKKFIMRFFPLFNTLFKNLSNNMFSS